MYSKATPAPLIETPLPEINELTTVPSTQTIHPSSKQLFWGFLKLGMMGFGGVLPLAHRMIVEDRQWLDDAQFTDLLGVCQILPGGNIINLAVALGYQFRGTRGAVSSIVGLITVPTTIVIALYELYAEFQSVPMIKHLIEGLAAAAAGLLFAMAFKMLRPIYKRYMTVFTIAMTFVFMLWVKIPLALTLIILVAINFTVLSLQNREKKA